MDSPVESNRVLLYGWDLKGFPKPGTHTFTYWLIQGIIDTLV